MYLGEVGFHIGREEGGLGVGESIWNDEGGGLGVGNPRGKAIKVDSECGNPRGKERGGTRSGRIHVSR